MKRRGFLVASVGVAGALAGCSGGNAILKFQTSSNIGKTRERELEEGQRLELAVKTDERTTTGTATVTQKSTGEVIAEKSASSKQWEGTEFEVPATETYEIHGESTGGETSRIRLRQVSDSG